MYKNLLITFLSLLPICTYAASGSAVNGANTNQGQNQQDSQSLQPQNQDRQPVMQQEAEKSVNATEKSGSDKNNTDVANQQMVECKDAWARISMSPNNNSAVYMTLRNNGNQAHSLVGVSAMTTANNAELHQSFVNEKGVSKMVSVDKIVLPPQTDVALAPGGLHIMLFDLKRSLKAGDKFKLDLKFENGKIQTVDVEVKDNK